MTLDSDVARLARTRPFTLMPREAVQLIAFSSKKRRWSAGEVAVPRRRTPATPATSSTPGIIALTEKGARVRERAAGRRRRAHWRERALRARSSAGSRPAPSRTRWLTRIEREIFRRVLARIPRSGREGPRGARRAHLAAGRGARRRPRAIASPSRRPPGAAMTGEPDADASAACAPRRSTISRRSPRRRSPGCRSRSAGFARVSSFRSSTFPTTRRWTRWEPRASSTCSASFAGAASRNRGAVEETGELPNMIWLYRRPLLDFWCDGDDTLARRRRPTCSCTRSATISAFRTPTWRRSNVRRDDQFGPAPPRSAEGPENRIFLAPSQGRHAHCRVVRGRIRSPARSSTCGGRSHFVTVHVPVTSPAIARLSS